MINFGLIRRAFRETWAITLVLSLAFAAICFILGFALPRFQQQILEAGGVPQLMAFVRNMMLGPGSAMASPGEIAAGIAWAHPVVLALTWAHAITLCTRIPAGEVERGTIDVLLGLPVSRWQLHVSETLVWLGSGAVMLLAGVGTSRLGAMTVVAEYRPPLAGLTQMVCNLFTLYACVGACALLFSAMSDRRGRAVTGAILLVLAWFILNYLGSIWDPAKPYDWLSAMHYYRTLDVIRGQVGHGGWPLRDMAVLGGAAAVAWTCAGIVLARRPLTTL